MTSCTLHTHTHTHTHTPYYNVQLSLFNYWVSQASVLVSWYRHWSTAQNYLVSSRNHDYWLLSQHYFAQVISLYQLWTILKAYFLPVYATLLLHNNAMIQLKMSNLPHCLSTVHEVIHKTSDVTSLVFFSRFLASVESIKSPLYCNRKSPLANFCSALTP